MRLCVCGFWGVFALACSRLAYYRAVLASMELQYNPASLCNTHTRPTVWEYD